MKSGVKASDLSGPGGDRRGARHGPVGSTDYRLALNFLVMLNINLAILNMLPLPVLDGGHILMAIIERIRRKPLEVRIVEYTTTGFAILLISFMAYVTMYYIKRLPLFRKMFNRDAQIEQHDSSTQPPADSGTRQDKPDSTSDKNPAPQTSTNP